MGPDIVFQLKSARAGYNGRPVLFDVDLEVRTNERVAVMGRSGAGKSTLLSLLYAQRPDRVALVPQASALVKPLSVFHNVYMGRLDRYSTAYNLRNLVWPATHKVAEVRNVLACVGLEGEIFSAAGALSGGQQQRTSVARALYNAGRSSSVTNPSRRWTACRAPIFSICSRVATRRSCWPSTTCIMRWSMPTALSCWSTAARSSMSRPVR